MKIDNIKGMEFAKVKVEDKKQIFPIIMDEKLKIYEMIVDQEKMKSYLDNLKIKYSEVEQQSYPNTLLMPGGEPSCFNNSYDRDYREVVDYIVERQKSNNHGGHIRFGGPVYADVLADIRYLPALYATLKKIAYSETVNLTDWYNYLVALQKHQNEDKSKSKNIKQLINEGFFMQPKMTKIELNLPAEELRNIIDEFKNHFTFKLINEHNLVNDNVLIDSSISVEQLNALKQNLQIGKVNGSLNHNDILKELNIFFESELEKVMVK